MTTTTTVSIPGPNASRSKMQKKGWKCWAKFLTSVKNPANDGYAYEGEFTQAGDTVEAEIGAVILHVDQSSSASIGVVMLNLHGKGFIKWLHNANSDGRAWCGPLGRPSRELLAMATSERISFVAREILAEDREEPLSEDAQAYWRSVAGFTPVAIAFDPTPIAEQIKALLANLTDDQVAEVYRLLPGVEHRE